MTSETGARVSLPSTGSADVSDTAQKVQDLHLQIALQQHAARAPQKLAPKRRCYNCDEDLDHPEQLYCDGDCAEDHDRRQKRKGA